ncbi:MAG: YbaK/EbsC family protein, partial [Trueperaceae bacterium]
MNRSDSVRRVRTALHQVGIDAEVRETPASTRTAQQAADAVGCELGQIVKSLLFLLDDVDPVLILVSGANRVDPARLGETLGRRVVLADAATVRDVTGFAIGGVAPVGSRRNVPIYLDADLMAYEVVWAAAGTPNAVFPVAPARHAAA